MKYQVKAVQNLNSLLESTDTKKVATVYEFSADPIGL